MAEPRAGESEIGAGQLLLLILDDYPYMRRVAAVSFGPYGYGTRVVGTSEEALDAVRAYQPDVILLEWNLRSGPTTGLAARLRAAAAPQPMLVIIALSVFEEPAGFREREAVDAYFVKPTAIAIIDQAIRALRNARAEASCTVSEQARS